MHGQMKPGAKLSLIEFKEGELPEGPPEALKIGKDAMIQLMTKAGFVHEGERKGVLPYQHMLIIARP